jgi:hypothetical protein
MDKQHLIGTASIGHGVTSGGLAITNGQTITWKPTGYWRAGGLAITNGQTITWKPTGYWRAGGGYIQAGDITAMSPDVEALCSVNVARDGCRYLQPFEAVLILSAMRAGKVPGVCWKESNAACPAGASALRCDGLDGQPVPPEAK